MIDDYLVFTLKELFSRQVDTILYLKDQLARRENEMVSFKKTVRMLRLENHILKSEQYRSVETVARGRPIVIDDDEILGGRSNVSVVYRGRFGDSQICAVKRIINLSDDRADSIYTWGSFQ